VLSRRKELSQGKKQSHWMWFVFPQLKGLGSSYNANYYGIANAEETKKYWENDYLKNNYLGLCKILLSLKETNVSKIFDYPDDLKLKSSLTLFYLVTKDEVVEKTLQRFFGLELDDFTVKALKNDF
jgi:uncharacterized protein (DUF1810 family)